MTIVRKLESIRKKALTGVFWLLVRWSPHYRDNVLVILRSLRLEKLVLGSSLARRLLLTKNEPRYAQILETRPYVANTDSDSELHILTCESDLLRCVWALKSFLLFSALTPRLFIHNDGTLSSRSLEILRTHFPGCTIPTEAGLREALSGYPMCQFYREKHVLARKILDVLHAARAEYLLVMDTDVLWFSKSNQILDCVRTHTPFYLPAIRDAYARNTKFMREHCGLNPGRHVNSGIIGYRRTEFLDLDFIEFALDKLVNIPPELVPVSIGFPVPSSVKHGTSDPVESVSWWVMEQTLYALLYGRCTSAVQLCVKPQNGNQAHPFVNRPITTDTALQHFILDRYWNAQFPVGVEYLLRNDFLQKWEQQFDAP